MAKNSETEYQKWEQSSSSEDEDEDEQEEALSFCDLVEEENQQLQQQKPRKEDSESEKDFDFGSLGGGSVLKESEMCSADDVFFKGQILPFQFSISSDNGLAGFRSNSRNPSRSISRSGSNATSYSGEFTSRSSSSRSQHSTISSNSTTKTTRIRNHLFNTQPSPKPQIRAFNTTSRPKPSSRRSIIWDFFHLGLVRTPEIELQDLKIRSKGNRVLKSEKKQRKQRLFDCRCSVETVESKIVVQQNLLEKEGNDITEESNNNNKATRKQAASRHRTFEWLKELSHPSSLSSS